MRVVDEEQMETLHLYVVPEKDLPPKPDFVGICIATICSLVLVSIISLVLFYPKAEPTISFQTTITGFRLPPVSKTMSIPIHATGKGHVNATYANGEITFYNGQTYTQIIPVGTILKGVDGVAVITDTQAIIPPAAQTTPPTYGQTSVPAHSFNAGTNGNIQAGDINTACCVTSVIAQNPYSFTGGANARDFTYLSRQDVTTMLASLVPTLKERTLAAFPSAIVLNPICITTSASSPALGQETHIATLIAKETCIAISYKLALAKKQIQAAGKQFGSLTTMQFSIIGIAEKKGGIQLRLYVTAVVRPIVHLRFGSTGK